MGRTCRRPLRAPKQTAAPRPNAVPARTRLRVDIAQHFFDLASTKEPAPPPEFSTGSVPALRVFVASMGT